MRKFSWKHFLVGGLAIVASLAILSFADAGNITINQNTLSVVETKMTSGCWNVSIIFTRMTSPQLAEKIVSDAMKTAREFGNVDILGSAWLWPDGDEMGEQPLYFTSGGKFLIMKKGSNEVKPFK